MARWRTSVAAAALAWLALQTIGVHALDLQSVNAAELSKQRGQRSKGIDPALVKVQVLLDRAGFSPGEIDGRQGENF